ncbi:hypothetical protein M5D96_001123 [Drosophila gunungcola]|uniref:AP180 N-terminal homology (ANTH) domain-containing protein n=1 Tax=Drosophila gunungcola TaxID=103775 RepID=A0A9Q0BUD9_9MUSC|nr:hypothetical protein M5D96_001123 [Drosophila gunungcola]
MNKKHARDALDLYKKFLVRMDRVGEFLKNVGIDKGDIPDLTKAPSSLLDALEQHLATLEGRKVSAANTPTQSSSNQRNVKSAVSALSSTSSAFGTAAASSKFDTTNGIDEQLKAQVLAEEEAAMNQYKSKVSSPTSSGAGGASAALTNPFLSSPPAAQAGQPIVDLFGAASAQPAAAAAATKASDDLLQLGNPFADMFEASGGGGAAAAGATGFNGASVSSAAATNAFVSDSNFSSVFGNTEPADPCNGIHLKIQRNQVLIGHPNQWRLLLVLAIAQCLLTFFLIRLKAHGMTVSPAPITISHPYIHASYPVMPNYMQGMPVMGQTSMMGQSAAPLTGAQPTMMAAPHSNATGIMQPIQPTQNGGNKGVPLDPFGAL